MIDQCSALPYDITLSGPTYLLEVRVLLSVRSPAGFEMVEF